jgi:hypothetical protein
MLHAKKRPISIVDANRVGLRGKCPIGGRCTIETMVGYHLPPSERIATTKEIHLLMHIGIHRARLIPRLGRFTERRYDDKLRGGALSE